MSGARASLDVFSKARGGDLARFGAGGASARGGEKEEEEEVAKAMVVPVAARSAYYWIGRM